MYVVFFNDTATTEIYTLSLHDALPIYPARSRMETRRRVAYELSFATLDAADACQRARGKGGDYGGVCRSHRKRSEEHTSELQSRQYLVCRLLLEKKKLGR